MIRWLGDEVASQMVEDLPPDQREAIRAHVLEDRDYAEIARSERLSEATVRKRVSRGLRVLRDRAGGNEMSSDYISRLRARAAARGRDRAVPLSPSRAVRAPAPARGRRRPSRSSRGRGARELPLGASSRDEIPAQAERRGHAHLSRAGRRRGVGGADPARAAARRGHQRRGDRPRPHADDHRSRLRARRRGRAHRARALRDLRLGAPVLGPAACRRRPMRRSPVARTPAYARADPRPRRLARGSPRRARPRRPTDGWFALGGDAALTNADLERARRRRRRGRAIRSSRST